MTRLPSLFLALPFLLLSYFALRFAWADYLFRSGTQEDITRAAQLVPSNARYQARLGNLRHAVQLNPYFAAAWLELATGEEGNGNIEEAERFLLQAAKMDGTFEPRWGLANFYFRQGRTQDFWKWLRLAAERSYGDRAALFQLAWRTGIDGREIEAKLTSGLPGVTASYFDWLRQEKKEEEVGRVALSLAGSGRKTDASRLLEACHQMVQDGRADRALPVWNALVGLGWVRGSVLPLDEAALTNPGLEWRPTGKAFDWALPWRAGLEHIWRPGQLTIRLSGKEDEKTELLVQTILLPEREPGYEFRYRYRAEGLPGKSGIRWKVFSGVREILSQGEDLSSGEWRQGRLRFRLPSEVGLFRLMLAYERLPGTVRPEGSITFEGGLSLHRMTP